MTFDLREDDPFRRNRSDYLNNELEVLNSNKLDLIDGNGSIIRRFD